MDESTNESATKWAEEKKEWAKDKKEQAINKKDDLKEKVTDKTDEWKDGDWHTAWHGSHIERIYSTLSSGKPKESRDEARGDRPLQNLPGVYLH